jgi:NhaP-type Na+/H+ or K+/H+ antiporter
LSLTLVLFTDAVSLSIVEVRRHSALAIRMLGPGTLLCAGLTALVAWRLFGIPFAAAAILGAALASTDPVLLRGLLRRRDIHATARQALQLESGLNDAVLLPVVIVAMAFMSHQGPADAASLARLSLKLFILGPGAGVAVGLVAVAALDLIRKRSGVRRDYESLYSLGVAFTAFGAAEALHGSGFLAAFAAGMTIAALDVELCDCFIEYGGVTAEMLLLFTFVLFGTSLIWTGFTVLSGSTLLFAAFVILIRPPVYLLSLYRSRVDQRGRLLIAWFGPRGLSSLLLVLLAVFAGIPGSSFLFQICSLVVLVSVVVHGSSPLLLARAARKELERSQIPPPPGGSGTSASVSTLETDTGRKSLPVFQVPPLTNATEQPAAEINEPPGNANDNESDRVRITIDQVLRLKEAGAPVIILDVRTDRSLDTSELQIEGAIRLPPDHVVDRARELGLPKDAWLIAYCA